MAPYPADRVFSGEFGTATEIGEDVFAYVQADGSWWINNAGFVIGPESSVTVDTCATERRTKAYLDTIRQVTDRPVRTIVNTHHHGDHTNGNSLLPEAMVVGHPEMRRAMLDTPIGGKDHIFGPIEWGDVARRPPDVTFEHRLRIHVGGHVVEAISMDGPAHTVGDVIVWVPHARAVFVGDLIFNGGTPFLVMGSVSGSHRAIEMIRGLEPEVIVPGHGPLCDYKVLDQTEDYLRFLIETATAALEAGLTPLEAARQADLGSFGAWSEPERIVGNLHRAYAELDPRSRIVDVTAAYDEMVAYNGGRLPCKV